MNFLLNENIFWLEIILLFVGIIFIIIGFFRPKDNVFIEEKIEKIFEDFITQIDVENEEMINKIKQTQNQLPFQIGEKIKYLEKRIEMLEDNRNSFSAQVQESNDPAPIPQLNQKYEEVLSLYQAGEDVDSISKKTNMGHAEIKLILELTKKGFKYA